MPFFLKARSLSTHLISNLGGGFPTILRELSPTSMDTIWMLYLPKFQRLKARATKKMGGSETFFLHVVVLVNFFFVLPYLAITVRGLESITTMFYSFSLLIYNFLVG